MGYMHIDNLYKNQDILLFKECYAMEKIHGTSAHITIRKMLTTIIEPPFEVDYFSGGEKLESFKKIFNELDIRRRMGFLVISNELTIFGEAYGGKCQGMSGTYGKELKFVAFDVKIGESWLDVPRAEEICKQLGIEFVFYQKVPTDIEILDKLASSPSIQSRRNRGAIATTLKSFWEFGTEYEDDKLREGIVLRPLIEVKKNNGERIIAKHKNQAFAERVNQPKLVKLSQDKLEVLKDVEKIANEWVTLMRLKHVLDKYYPLRAEPSIEDTKEIIGAMIEDITREAKGEIIDSKVVRNLIGKKTATLFKKYLQNRLRE